MKAIFVITLSLGLMANSHAQDVKPFYDSPYNLRNSGSFNKKSFLLSAGVGFGGAGNYDISFNYPAKASYSPSLHLDVEHGFFRDEIGISGSFETGWGSRTFQYLEKIQITSISILGFYHFNKLISIKKLDAYIGFGHLYTIETITLENPSDQQKMVFKNFGYEYQVGLRYYFIPKVSINVRYKGSYHQNNVSCGITFRLK